VAHEPVENVSGNNSDVQPTGPDNSEIRKYASIYLVRLGIVGALLALYAMGII